MPHARTPAAALRRAVLERRAHAAARRAAYVALPVLAASGLTLAFGPSELYAAFAALFGVLAAGALLTPLATVALMSVLDRVLARRAGIPVTLAVRGVSASLSRTGVATAALAVAVATVNGVGLMIASFRASLDDWLQTTLTADIYLSAPEGDGVLSELVASGALAELPGVEGLSLDSRARRADGARRRRGSGRAARRARLGPEARRRRRSCGVRSAGRRNGRHRVGALVVREPIFASATCSSCRRRAGYDACRSSARFAISTPACRLS